jgi:serine/threonine protein kinase
MAKKTTLSASAFGPAAGLEDNGLALTLESKLNDKTVAAWKGKHLGHFKLLGMLGRGGMGVVIRAEDRGLNRQVALKVLPQNAGKATVRVEQFIREARAAAKLEHNHIVTIYEVGAAAGYYYIAMELVEGGNLFELIRANGPLETKQACQIAAEAGEALAYAHRLGIVHRDIKPANLMLTRAGRCKVTDFGLAKVDDPNDLFQLPNTVMGTPSYIPPEVAGGKPATPLSDIYCLGATLWYLLVGLPPYDGKNPQEIMWKHVNAPLPKLRKFRPDVPKALVKVIGRALSKKPEERFQSVEEFARVLRTYTIGMSEAAPGKLAFKREEEKKPGKWWAKNKWRVAAAAAVAVVGLGVVAQRMNVFPSVASADVLNDLVPAGDTAQLNTLAGREVRTTVEVQGRVASLELIRKGSYWAMRFEGADSHNSFRAVFPRSMAVDFEKRLGGAYGSGVIGKRVILQGNLAHPPDEPVQMLLDRPQQITVIGE